MLCGSEGLCFLLFSAHDIKVALSPGRMCKVDRIQSSAFTVALVQEADASVGGSLLVALRAGLKAYRDKWLGTAGSLPGPQSTPEGNGCRDLQARCVEWAALVWTDSLCCE